MASFPTSVYSPASKSAGQTITASFFNDPEAEIIAIEAGFRNGTAPLNSSGSTLATLSVTGGSTLATLSVTGGSTFAGNLAMASTAVVIGSSSVPVQKVWCSALDIGGTAVVGPAATNSQLSGNVTVVNAATWYDGPSVNLTAGTWLVIAHAHVAVTGGVSGSNAITIRISDGSTHYGSAGGWSDTADVRPLQLSQATLITLVGAATIKIQIASSAGTSDAVLLAATVANGAGNNATQITAIRVA